MTFCLIIAIITYTIHLSKKSDKLAKEMNYAKGAFNLDLQKKIFFELYEDTLDYIEMTYRYPCSNFKKRYDSPEQRKRMTEEDKDFEDEKNHRPVDYYGSLLFDCLRETYGLPSESKTFGSNFYGREIHDGWTRGLHQDFLKKERENSGCTQREFYIEKRNEDVLRKIFFWDARRSLYTDKKGVPQIKTGENANEVCENALLDIVTLRTRKEMYELGYEFVARFEANPSFQKKAESKRRQRRH